MEQKAKKNDTEGRLKRLQVMEAHWDEIIALLNELPVSETVSGLLKELGAPGTPSEIGVDKEILRNTLLYCKEIRARYTILQMLWDLGMLEDLTDELIAEGGI